MQALLWDPERGIRGGVSATCVRPKESGILLTDTTEGQQKLVQAISDIMTPRALEDHKKIDLLDQRSRSAKVILKNEYRRSCFKLILLDQDHVYDLARSSSRS